MPDVHPQALIAVARREHENVAASLASHRQACRAQGGYCPDCVSLEAHVARTLRQVELLDPPGETEALF